VRLSSFESGLLRSNAEPVAQLQRWRVMQFEPTDEELRDEAILRRQGFKHWTIDELTDDPERPAGRAGRNQRRWICELVATTPTEAQQMYVNDLYADVYDRYVWKTVNDFYKRREYEAREIIREAKQSKP
jgi:hypothetical protein